MPIFFTIARSYWEALSEEEKHAIKTAEAAAKTFNDEGVASTEKDAAAFFEGKGVKVTTPDVAAFRDHVQKAFLESKFAESWPKGMLDRINKAGA